MSDNLKSKTVKGLKWSSIENIFQQIFQVIFGIIMGRLLFPQDFGLFGVLSVFVALSVMLQDGGFGVALIQKQEVKKEEYNSVFYFSFFISVLIYISLFCSAPYISNFYDKPILKDLSRLLFISFIFSSLGIVPSVILTRKLEFKSLALTSIISLFVSLAVAIIFALKDYGVWALCIQTIVYHCTRACCLWYFSKWKPYLSFSFSALKNLFSFGSKILTTNIIHSITSNLAPSIIGKYYNMDEAGLYSQATRWYNKPISVFTAPILALSIPVISSVNGDDERQKRVFRKMIKTIAFVAFPITILFVYIAYEFILITVKSEWEASVPYLQLMCLGAIFAPLETLYWNLIASRKKSGTLFILVLCKQALMLTILFFSIRYGIFTLLINIGIVNYLFFVIESFYIFKLINYKKLEFCKDTFPYLIASCAVVAVVYPFLGSIENLYISIILKFGIPAILYLAIMHLGKSEILSEGFESARNTLKKISFLRK